MEKDFVSIDENQIDDLFDDEDFNANYATAQDYVNYILYIQAKKIAEPNSERLKAILETVDSESKYDIPFTPRHSF